jgi:integrase
MRLKLYRGIWHGVTRENGKTKRFSLGTRDRAAAERAFADAQRVKAGDTVAEIMTAYLADKKHAARSYLSMETAWRALAPTFGALRPDQITRDLCRKYTAQRRASGRKDGTIIKDLGVLRAAVTWAGKAAGAAFEMPHTPPPRERYLTREEVDRLIEAATMPHVKLFILLAWSTAGRASALLELTWDRVEFERNQIRLAKAEGRRKGRATVPMTARLNEALRAAYEVRETQFVIEWGGKPVKSLKRSFATAAELAGIEDVSPHVMRHSAAVRMAEEGVPMVEIAQYLGHTDPRVTYRTYARFSPDYLRRAAKALE